MTKFLEELESRRRFGMRPGLDTIRSVCSELGNPQNRLKNVIHVAGTNGKGAVCAILDAALGNLGTVPTCRHPGTVPTCRHSGTVPIVARYTSPHLIRINERFFLNGRPISGEYLDAAAERVQKAASRLSSAANGDLTFFEALTAVAFVAFAESNPEYAILETGLGGRLDATNICQPKLTIITKIGLDHCDWLGDTVEKIAAEKAGIIKPGVPIVLAKNDLSVRKVVEARSKEVGAPFYYAPELANDGEIPQDFSLYGSFNRENAVTALAALKVLFSGTVPVSALAGFAKVVWPGRFQRIGNVIIDGAHNPPAARALVAALGTVPISAGTVPMPAGTVPKYDLIVGFCGDKDINEVLKILAPVVRRAWAVKTCNPRSLSADELVMRLRKVGIEANSCNSLQLALEKTGTVPGKMGTVPVLVCGSLFLAGEAVSLLGGYPWDEGGQSLTEGGQSPKIDPSELLKQEEEEK